MLAAVNDPSWEQLVAAEPKLAALLAEAQAVSSEGQERFCANTIWYSRFKPRLLPLVGWDSLRQRDPLLGSEGAYNRAYDVLYDALPDCRNCFCF